MLLQTKKHFFDSAHFLEGHSGRCANMHGHTWTVVATIEGEPQGGMFIDFHILNKVLAEIVDKLDHITINEVVDYPSAENIAEYIVGRLMSSIPIPELKKLRVISTSVQEGQGGSATYVLPLELYKEEEEEHREEHY